jgi:hypothetical protein
MSEFKRGLTNPAFISELKSNHYFQSITNDVDLFVAIRDNYLSVYHYGQSLFEIRYQNGNLKWKSHKKYVGLDEDGYIDTSKDLDKIEEIKMKSKAFIRKEKEQVKSNILKEDSLCIIDTEITFGRDGDYGRRSIDFLAVDKRDEKLKLVFYEAKLFDNPELRAFGTPKVFSQIEKYEQVLHDNDHRTEITNSYKIIYENIRELNLNNKKKLVQLVASNIDSLEVDPKPKLMIFITEDYMMKDKHIQRLQNHFGNERIMLIKNGLLS